jgi:3-hydroxyisobutyrate dehydrogenase
MNDERTVAVLGAGGTMGFAMARNLARAGFKVRAWNRSREKAEPLGEDGATVLDTAAEAAQGAEVILTMLSSGDAVIESIDAALEGELADSAVWLQMSTIGEQDTERCTEIADDRGVQFVDAPVLGTKQPAEQGELVILASGPDELRDRVEPIFDVVGKRTMWVGEAGAGSRLKVATNSWLVTIVEGAAETLALAEGMGLDPQLVLDAVADGPLDLPYLGLKGKAMIERSFEPSFALKLATKDAGLAVASAKLHDLDLPLLKTIHDRFEQGAREHGDEDLSATFLTSAPPKR